MEKLKPENHTDSISLALYLHTVVAFTSASTWVVLKNKNLQNLKSGMAQLCNNILGGLVQKGFFISLRNVLIRGTCRTTKPVLKPVSLTAIMNLATRPLIAGNFTENLMSMFVTQILAVPALIFQLETITPEVLGVFQTHKILQRCMDLLGCEQSLRIVTNSLQGTQSLALLANIIDLYNLENVESAKELCFPNLTFVITRLLQSIPQNVGTRGGACSQWHELLGWFCPGPDAPKNENLSLIKKQVHHLWSHRSVKFLFGDYLKELIIDRDKIEFHGPIVSSGNLLKRALERSKSQQNKNEKNWKKLGSTEVTRVSLVCAMYNAALTTLNQLRLDILSGLCYSDSLIHDLWLLLASVGPNCGMKGFLELLQLGSNSYAPPLLMLLLFCDCMTHYVT